MVDVAVMHELSSLYSHSFLPKHRVIFIQKLVVSREILIIHVDGVKLDKLQNDACLPGEIHQFRNRLNVDAVQHDHVKLDWTEPCCNRCSYAFQCIFEVSIRQFVVSFSVQGWEANVNAS